VAAAPRWPRAVLGGTCGVSFAGEEGRRHLLLGDAIRADAPVHILQGMQDKYVPWTHAMVLAEKIASDPVSLTLIKYGDHRLARDEDLARLIAAIDGMGWRCALTMEQEGR